MSTPADHPNQHARGWTLGIVSLGLFMVVLDNLVVSVALPSIHRQLGSSIQSLEWTVNAYVLSYAVLLLTGAALGDRLGRKRMFIAGIVLFTAASAAAATRSTGNVAALSRSLKPWILPSRREMSSASPPASSTAFHGSVNSTCSTPSVARKATRLPSSADIGCDAPFHLACP